MPKHTPILLGFVLLLLNSTTLVFAVSGGSGPRGTVPNELGVAALAPRSRAGFTEDLSLRFTNLVASLSIDNASARAQRRLRRSVKRGGGEDGLPKEGLAIAALVLGIMSIPYYGAFVLGPLAIVFGIMAFHRLNKDENTFGGKNLAKWGMILGGISTLASVVFVSLFLSSFR